MVEDKKRREYLITNKLIMGFTNAPGSCYLTNLEATNIGSDKDFIEYFIFDPVHEKVKVTLNASSEYWDSHYEELTRYKHIVLGLFQNGKLSFFDEPFQTIETIKERINEFSFPRNQKEKLNNLFMKIFDFQNYEGDNIKTKRFKSEWTYSKLFFKNQFEYSFYLNALNQKKLIESSTSGEIRVSYDGLDFAVRLKSDGRNSNKCFIAMSFNSKDIKIREIRSSIMEACYSTGYDPVLMDESNFDSDQTINEAMISEIKSSKFCIVDFTAQRQNVYFEAGYALGRGIKVIYCCSENDADNIHFDTRQFPHIRYKNGIELRTKLINKIKVWINE